MRNLIYIMGLLALLIGLSSGVKGQSWNQPTSRTERQENVIRNYLADIADRNTNKYIADGEQRRAMDHAIRVMWGAGEIPQAVALINRQPNTSYSSVMADDGMPDLRETPDPTLAELYAQGRREDGIRKAMPSKDWTRYSKGVAREQFRKANKNNGWSYLRMRMTEGEWILLKKNNGID